MGATISYGKSTILHNADFSAKSGMGTAVLGENGAGKSTLLKTLSGVLRPASGSVTLDGADIYGKEHEKLLYGKIGFVPQGDILFEDLSVADNLLFLAQAAGVKKQSILTSPVLETLGVTDLKKKAKSLSGGNRKKCAIAAAAISKPQVLVLDEPFSYLDVNARRELTAFLLRLKANGTAIVITSHNKSEISSLCEKHYLVSCGKLREISGADEFFNNMEVSNEQREH